MTCCDPKTLCIENACSFEAQKSPSAEEEQQQQAVEVAFVNRLNKRRLTSLLVKWQQKKKKSMVKCLKGTFSSLQTLSFVPAGAKSGSQ